MALDDDTTAGPRGFGAGVPEGAGRPRSASGIDGGEGGEAGEAPRRRAEPRGAGAAAARAAEALVVAGTFGEPGGLALEPLAKALARALAEPADAAGRPRPSTGAIEEAARAALTDPTFARAGAFALRPHWSEPLCAWAGRWAAALTGGVRVLVVPDAALGPSVAAAAEALSKDLPSDALQVVLDDRLDATRALAATPDIELEVSAPDAFATGLTRALGKLRRTADFDGAALERAVRHARSRGWFGEGVIEEPRAEVRVREPRGRTIAYAVGAAARAVGTGAGPGVDVTLAESLEPAEAAAEVAHLAFGQAVLGGYGPLAASRVLVGAHHFSAFTEALLELLEGPDPDEGLHPPEWALEDGPTGGPLARRLDDAVLAARRIALDEGATLVHERRTQGRRRVVFTNVEPRMRLGSRLRGPSVLALLRARD